MERLLFQIHSIHALHIVLATMHCCRLHLWLLNSFPCVLYLLYDSKFFVSEIEQQTLKLNNIRTRRNINKARDQQPPMDINYEFEAFQQDFNINLTLDSTFSSPYIIQKGNVSWIDTPYLSNADEKSTVSQKRHRSCIYTGAVNGEPDSIGVADICHHTGMVISHPN